MLFPWLLSFWMIFPLLNALEFDSKTKYILCSNYLVVIRIFCTLTDNHNVIAWNEYNIKNIVYLSEQKGNIKTEEIQQKQ